MKIEIWSDIVCPFCYIGKRNFENALQSFSNKDDVEVIWKSFQLNPAISSEEDNGSYQSYLSQKTGWSSEETEKALNSMSEMAKSVGLDYKLTNLKAINTFETQRIIQYAKLKGLDNEAEEAFFKAYFTEEKDLTQREVQVEVLKSIGLNEEDLEKALSDDLYQKMVKADIEEAKQLQITGVPFFVFNRKYAISGAQPSEVFLETLQTAFGEWKEENPKPNFQVIDGQSCDVDGNCD